MIKTDDSLDQLRIRKTTGISTALVQLQRQPARRGTLRRGQLPGVLQRRNLIQPGRIVPGFLHRRGVDDLIEHVFEYSAQPGVCHSISERLAGVVGSSRVLELSAFPGFLADSWKPAARCRSNNGRLGLIAFMRCREVAAEVVAAPCHRRRGYPQDGGVGLQRTVIDR